MLTERANQAGGHDNITVIVAMFEGAGCPTRADDGLAYQKYPLPERSAADFSFMAAPASEPRAEEPTVKEDLLREPRRLRVGAPVMGLTNPLTAALSVEAADPSGSTVRADESSFDEPIELPTSGLPRRSSASWCSARWSWWPSRASCSCAELRPVRRALRRLASILLTLFATSLLSLWALSQLSDGLGSPRGQLPTFFNPAPRSARVLAESSIEAFARGGDELRAARELNRLGGAALPHVLAQFDALSPAVRGKLALALSPIAGRMAIASPNDFATPEAAVLFWTRFWQDRAIDFKPQLVRRLVTRLAENRRCCAARTSSS